MHLRYPRDSAPDDVFNATDTKPIEEIPGATVVLEGPALKDPRTVVSNDRGFFEFNDVEPGTTYHLTISAQGFANWNTGERALSNLIQQVVLRKFTPKPKDQN
jgi:hypothetical protein